MCITSHNNGSSSNWDSTVSRNMKKQDCLVSTVSSLLWPNTMWSRKACVLAADSQGFYCCGRHCMCKVGQAPYILSFYWVYWALKRPKQVKSPSNHLIMWAVIILSSTLTFVLTYHYLLLSNSHWGWTKLGNRLRHLYRIERILLRYTICVFKKFSIKRSK